MNEKFADIVINHIKKKQELSVSDERICRYGIEGLFSFFIKTAVILVISLFFNLFTEVLIFMLIYGPLRSFGFGIHASKDIYCWITSIIIYIIIPYISAIISITYIIYYSLFIVFSTLMVIYSPADTPKRPLIRANKRKRNQKLLLIFSIIYFIASIFITNNFIDNAMLIAIGLQAVCVNPITYKIFNTQYNNYLYYKTTKV